MALESLHLKKEFEIRRLLLSTILNIKVTLFLKVSITITGNFSMWRMALPKSLFPTKNRHLSLCKRVNFSSSLQTNTTLLGPPPAILPVLFTAGFYSDTANLSLLANKKLVCQKKETELLQALALEGKSNFSPKINPASPAALERRYNQPFGGEQLIGIYLEMLLISLMRQYTSSEEKKETPSENTKKDASASLLKTDSILFNRITDYYEAHITEHIKVEHLCKEFGIGRSHLQRIFREQTGYGAIEYFCQMRISAAKRCIRENRMNLTDTAASLGYTSIYYFSKQFKKITGMSPSQYQKMVRSSKKDPLYEQREL